MILDLSVLKVDLRLRCRRAKLKVGLHVSQETIADVPSDVEPPSKSASNDHSSDDDAKPSIEIKTPEFFPKKI